jgi:hypothetical protein
MVELKSNFMVTCSVFILVEDVSIHMYIDNDTRRENPEDVVLYINHNMNGPFYLLRRSK